MSLTTTCPKCARLLHVDEHTVEEWLTCPACLETFRNPHGIEAVTAAAPEQPFRNGPPVLDFQAKSDGKRMVAILTLLGTLGLLGNLILLIRGISQHGRNFGPGGSSFFVWVGCTLFLGVAWLLGVIRFSRHFQTALATLGFTAMAIGAFFALGILVFASCVATLRF